MGFLMVFVDLVSSGLFFLLMMNFGWMLGFLVRKLMVLYFCWVIVLGDMLFWYVVSFELLVVFRLLCLLVKLFDCGVLVVKFGRFWFFVVVFIFLVVEFLLVCLKVLLVWKVFVGVWIGGLVKIRVDMVVRLFNVIVVVRFFISGFLVDVCSVELVW